MDEFATDCARTRPVAAEVRGGWRPNLTMTPEHWITRRRIVRNARGALWASSVILLLVLLGVVLGTILVALQAQRDERRQVDAVVLMTSEVVDVALLDHALDLYRRGYARRIVLVGDAITATRALLLERGLAETTLGLVEPAASHRANMRSLADVARREGVRSALLVAPAAELLLDLKVTRDLGLQSFGAPLHNTAPSVLALVEGSFAYWQYVLGMMNAE